MKERYNTVSDKDADAVGRAFRLTLRLARLANGPAAEAMRRRGMDYEVIYGVQLPVLEAELKAYAARRGGAVRDHSLALALRARPEREARLAAIMSADPQAVVPSGAAEWSAWICGTETAETFARSVLPECPDWEAYALAAAESYDGRGEGTLCAYAALLAAARAAVYGGELDRDRWAQAAARIAGMRPAGPAQRAAETLSDNLRWAAGSPGASDPESALCKGGTSGRTDDTNQVRKEPGDRLQSVEDEDER